MKILIAVGVVIAVILMGAFAINYYGETTHTGCVVTEKDRTKNQDGSSDARVYTENCGTFVVADTLVKGQFNSADEFGKIEEGKTYDLTTIGFRQPIFSMFPNIIESKEVN